MIAEEIALPELEMGDLVIGEMMGAYTAATATDFNSLNRASIVVLNEIQSEIRSQSIHAQPYKLKHTNLSGRLNIH